MSTAILEKPQISHDPYSEELGFVVTGPYLEEDDIPMESEWHLDAMMVLKRSLRHHFLGREDYYVGGNMFIYFPLEGSPTRGVRGPDFFYVEGAPLKPRRRYWVVEEEDGRYPDVIIELASPTTRKFDQTDKRRIYQEIFQTHEYFTYDPDGEVLLGWRLGPHGEYEEIASGEYGRLYSEKLKMWLGPWEGMVEDSDGTVLRFFDERGNVIPLPEEYARNLEKLANQQAKDEKKRADKEKARAKKSEKENAQLRQRIAELEQFGPLENRREGERS